MWNFIIKRELNKTIVDMNKKRMPVPAAKNKLNDLVTLTKENAPKGQKRELKKNIFKVKKQFKIWGSGSSIYWEKNQTIQ